MTHLILPVGTRDHTLGAKDAPFTLVEYGNYERSHCASTERIVALLQRRMNANLRFVYRHFPPARSHSASWRAAEAAEAAGAQGKFWEMHRILFEHTHRLDDATLVFCAATLGLDIPRFLRDLKQRAYAQRVREDFESGLGSGVRNAPTLYINGVRHDDYGDVDTLVTAMESSLMETEGKFAVHSPLQLRDDAKQRPSLLSLSRIRRNVLAGSAAAAAFGLFMLAVPSHAQNIVQTPTLILKTA